MGTIVLESVTRLSGGLFFSDQTETGYFLSVRSGPVGEKKILYGVDRDRRTFLFS